MALVDCPGCGLRLESPDTGLDARFYASSACLQLYWELSAFTLSLMGPSFIHQLAVNAYAAQHSGPQTKPIRTAFSLMGLCLTFERGYSGREVQLAHMEMGKSRTAWPVFHPPPIKNMLNVRDALRDNLALDYRELLRNWGSSVWYYWKPEHERVRRLLELYLDTRIKK